MPAHRLELVNLLNRAVWSSPVAATLLLIGLTSNAYADFTGRVVNVADGDTINVLRERTQVKVRLLEIDAPEKAQAFGAKSKESLSEMCFGKAAELSDNGKDRYPAKKVCSILARCWALNEMLRKL